MRKKYIWIIIAIIFTISLLNIKSIRRYVSESFWSFAANQFEKEETERKEKIAGGEIVRGKDTVLIWNNMYVIYHINDEKCLTVEIGDVDDDLLDGIQKHKIKKNKLFITSNEGYAVIDKDGVCRMYITVPEDEYVNGFEEDEEGNRYYISKKIQHPQIKYLSTFDEFEEDEKMVLEKMIK